MLKTILFDLDGTLLPMDVNVFLNKYFSKLTNHLTHIAEPREMQRKILESTEAMICDNSPDKTNQVVFFEDFFKKLSHKPEELIPIFNTFYSREFSELMCCTEPTPLAREICLELVNKGYRLVLATNPIFPLEATLHRMKWAGVHDIPWELVTTYEHCHYCKPNPNYFREILEKVGATPGETLMVGNDTKEDLAAKKLGIKTYLVTDYLINHGGQDYDADFEGRLEDFLKYAKGLPKIKEQRTP